MRHLFFTLAFFLTYVGSSSGQCSCTNCPLVIPDNTTVTSTLDVSGLSNGTLGTGGQGICEIRLHFETDAIEEIDIKLTTPSSQMITLIERISGFGIDQNLTFDITFVPCGATAVPDPSYPAVFDPNAYDTANNLTFTGSYYPGDGQCLEDLIGNANGMYTMTFEDFVPGDPHEILDWEIIFCDGAGLSCTPAPVCTPGELLSVNFSPLSFCEGDPALLMNSITNQWNGSAPDPSLYETFYYVQDNNTGVFFGGVNYSGSDRFLAWGVYNLWSKLFNFRCCFASSSSNRVIHRFTDRY